MAGFFASLPHKFDYDVKGGIGTRAFLAAASDSLRIFDLLGPTVWALVRNDCESQLQRIREIAATDTGQDSSLQGLVLAEVKAGRHTDQYSACNALSWLRRHLHFISVFYTELVNSELETDACVETAYDKSLRVYHNIFQRGVVSIAKAAAPSRHDLLATLGGANNTDEATMEEIRTYNRSLRQTLRILKTLFVSLGLEEESETPENFMSLSQFLLA